MQTEKDHGVSPEGKLKRPNYNRGGAYLGSFGRTMVERTASLSENTPSDFFPNNTVEPPPSTILDAHPHLREVMRMVGGVSSQCEGKI